MCALYPSLFPNFGWPEHTQIQQNYIYGELYETTSFTQPEPQQNHPELDRSASFTTDSGTDPTTVKKLNHNASERDRRKRINNMYTLLRSLLPASEQSKKLSIPATVSHVLKYIPEVQSQVERLIQKKEEVLSKINSRVDSDNGYGDNQFRSKTAAIKRSLATVSTNRVSDREVVIQICTFKEENNKNGGGSDDSLPHLLLNLEEDGFQLLNASSFHSVEGRVFHNLHLQVDVTQRLDCDLIREKLLTLY